MTMTERLTQIAQEHLGIETLEQRGRDALDFHEVGVAGLKGKSARFKKVDRGQFQFAG
ncbi:MAG: hypothetical protein HS101_19770 [Planctomycetia bacterium]|nr:hypothetical protein [Planctomycetia bacterium]MCC7315702.1 hypothetical protein [Planctomycetota bacterium]